MPTPRYRPRDYIAYPEEFGKYQKLTLLRHDSLEERARVQAAFMQSLYAFRVRRFLLTRKMTRKDFARETGINYGRLSRLLTGEIIMTFEDLGRFAVVERSIIEPERPESYV